MSQLTLIEFESTSTTSETSVHYVSVHRSRQSARGNYQLCYGYSTLALDDLPDAVHEAARENVDRHRTGHVMDIVFDEAGEVLHLETDSDSMYRLKMAFFSAGQPVARYGA